MKGNGTVSFRGSRDGELMNFVLPAVANVGTVGIPAGALLAWAGVRCPKDSRRHLCEAAAAINILANKEEEKKALCRRLP